MFLQHMVNGVVLGSMYALIAVAYTMVYGIIGLVNFAFGEVFMLGAFAGLLLLADPGNVVSELLPSLGLPSAVAVIGGIGVGALVGVAVERIGYKPLRGWPVLSLLISSIAMSVILRALGQFLFGAADAPYPSLVPERSFEIGGAVVQAMDVVVVAASGAVMALFAWLVKATPLGRAMRATAQDPEAALLMGIKVDSIIVGAFALGSALAAASGILYASHFRFANPSMGFVPGLKGLVAAVVGGVGNMPGAFVGGMLLGVVETLTAAYVPLGSAYRDAVAFAVLVAILWVRPQGLLGLRVGERV